MRSIEEVAHKYRSLRFNSIGEGLAELLRQAEENEVSYLEFADMLVEHEQKMRNRKRIELNRRKASFPTEKHLEGFDFRYQTTITKRQVNRLLTKVLFQTALELVESLELAELKGELKKKIVSLLKFDLLIIDELGYLPMSKRSVYNLVSADQ